MTNKTMLTNNNSANPTPKVSSLSDLKSKYPIIEFLKKKRVVAFDMDDPYALWMTECCDEYFGCKLSRSEVLQLASFLTEAAELFENDEVDYMETQIDSVEEVDEFSVRL